MRWGVGGGAGPLICNSGDWGVSRFVPSCMREEDFSHLKQIIHGVIHGLDHKFLNDQAPFDAINPSAENIAKYFYDETARQMKAFPNGGRIARITIWETDTTSATYWP